MAEKLEEYNKKRHFDKTDEPEGDVPEDASGRLRFVVQHHIASRDHYDFRLEWDSVLKSWAVPKGPSFNTKDKRLALQVEDHPFDYRNFEGTIPQGEYGGGTVMLWDEGYWETVEEDKDVDKGLREGALKVRLFGERLKGGWALVKIKPRKGEKDNNWLLIKEKDEFAGKSDISDFTTSVRTGRTMEEIAENKPSKKAKEKSSSRAKKTKTVKKREAFPDKLEIDGVKISSPNKVLYAESGIRKGDVANYYAAVADVMLPYLGDRLISSVRCPKGIESACFFKKHPGSDTKGVGTLMVSREDKEPEEYYYVKDNRGLLSEVQMNTLEFHLWGSSVKDVDKPNMMVFDLDPDEGMKLDRVRDGVRDLKEILDGLSLVSFLKISGGKGYHIVVPFKPSGSWQAFRDFAHNIAKLMEVQWSDKYTSNSRKVERKGRIYVDWQRNIRGATSVSPYSLRAKEDATVSMPLLWEELDVVEPHQVTLDDALDRLHLKDPWEGYFEIEQELKQ